MCRNFFTLIELIIVTAIIGILMTFLLPSLSRAREQAKIVVCLSNQKQLSVAYNNYAVANNQNAVHHTWYRDFIGIKGSHEWGDHLEKNRPLNAYAHSKIARCPSDKGTVLRTWNYNEFIVFGSSYFTNMASSSSIDKATNITGEDGAVWSSGVKISKFDYTDKKIIFYNSNLGNGMDWNHVSGKAKWHNLKSPREPVSFIDGHAEYFNFYWKKSSPTAPSFSSKELKIKGIGYY